MLGGRAAHEAERNSRGRAASARPLRRELPSGEERQLLRVSRVGQPVASTRRRLLDEAADERAVVVQIETETSVAALPDNGPEPLAGRAQRRFHRLAWRIAAHPRREVIERLAVRQDGGKADDASVGSVRSPAQPLHEDLVSDFPLGRADQVTLVQHDKLDVVDDGWVAPQREVELSGVAMTIGLVRNASSSPSETPLAPYREETFIPSGAKVRRNDRSV